MTTTDSLSTFDIRRLHVDDAYYLPSLRLILGPTDGGVSNEPVFEFLDSIAGSPNELGLVFAAMEHDRVISACAALTSPGRSGLVMLPPVLPARATTGVLTRQAQSGWTEGVRLLEILTRPGDESNDRIFAAAGYARLTALVYMRKRLNSPTKTPLRSDLEWVNYDSSTHALFERSIAASYEQSLDCPELSDLRTVPDALAGHQATGEFDPTLWWVALNGGQPVGLILLSKIRSRQAVELVYMGVSPGARGQGIGNALLAKGSECAVQAGANTLALAVDRRNRPALDLYLRSGFIEAGIRDAWITHPGRKNTTSRESES